MPGNKEFQSHVQNGRKVPLKYSGTDEDSDVCDRWCLNMSSLFNIMAKRKTLALNG